MSAADRYKPVSSSVATDTVYKIQFEPSGWAVVLVSDSTGVLSIVSDWGDFSYRWNIASLGSDDAGVAHTLTTFLASGRYDYVARKLLGSSSLGLPGRWGPKSALTAAYEILVSVVLPALNPLLQPDAAAPRKVREDYKGEVHIGDRVESWIVPALYTGTVEAVTECGDWFDVRCGGSLVRMGRRDIGRRWPKGAPWSPQ